MLAPNEARRLLDSINMTTDAGRRDRALIGLMVYSFVRIGAALAMRVDDVEEYLLAYIDGCGLCEDRKGPLFRTIGRKTKRLSGTPLPQPNAFAMVRWRAPPAEIETAIGNHSFRATGITTYLKNGGTLETAATMANHSSTRTTQLDDRRPNDVTLDEVERVLI